MEFMDRANWFINAEDTLKALTTLQQSEMEQVDWKAVGQRRGHGLETRKRGASNAKRKGEALAQPCRVQAQ